MTNTKKIEELSINQAMGQLYNRIDGHHLKDDDRVLKSFYVLEKALVKAHEDNYSKIKEIANILQETAIKDFKSYNSKY